MVNSFFTQIIPIHVHLYPPVPLTMTLVQLLAKSSYLAASISKIVAGVVHKYISSALQ